MQRKYSITVDKMTYSINNKDFFINIPIRINTDLL